MASPYHRRTSRRLERLDGGRGRHDLSAAKAREILHDGSVRGHALTARQRRYMGAVASGRSTKH